MYAYTLTHIYTYSFITEKEMSTHSSILSWEIPWTEESDSYSPWGCSESNMTEHVLTYTYKHQG